MRLDRRAGDGDLAFDVARREARQLLDPPHPLARGLAGLGEGIDQSEVGMRRQLPGARDEPRRLPALALGGEDAPGDLGGRHERGRKPQRLARQGKRLVGVAPFQLARLRRQQHGAAAQRHALIDMAVLPGDGQRIERALVVAGARLHVEQRVDAPGEARIALHRLLGESARRVRIVAARRFEEQAAHPEQLRLGTVEHGLEGAPCRVAVASELRRLRPQQRRQRLARQIAAGDAGIALRQRAVADADGEQPARQRVIALLPPPLARGGRLSPRGA